MPNKVAAVHFNPKYRPHLQHNDRTNSRSANIHHDLTHRNECDKPAQQAIEEIDKLYNEAIAILDKAKKKGKRTPKERSYHEAIFEIQEDTTLEQCQKLADQIAELTGFRRIQVSIHRDEGHEEGGVLKPHYHAHAVFFTLDRETGKQLARLQASLNPKNLSKIQDLASETLEMRRGREFYKAGKPAPKMIQNQNDFKRFKDQERILIAENQKIALELTEMAKILNLKEKEIKDTTERLKALEIDLNYQKQEIQKTKDKYQKDFYKAFEIQKQQYQNKFSFWKNIVTFGRHGKKIQKDYQDAKELLTLSVKNAEVQANQKVLEFQRLINEIEERRKQKELELIKELEYRGRIAQELENLKIRYSKIYQENQEMKKILNPPTQEQKTQEQTRNKSRRMGF